MDTKKIFESWLFKLFWNVFIWMSTRILPAYLRRIRNVSCEPMKKQKAQQLKPLNTKLKPSTCCCDQPLPPPTPFPLKEPPFKNL